MTKALSRLATLEIEIENGIRSVGQSLIEIQNDKLYKANHSTFESYCKERWGFSDRYARTLIESEKVKAKIGTIVPVLNLKTSHLSEISKIPEKQQAQVTAEVLERCEAENREPTAKDFKRAAAPFIKPPEPAAEEVYEDVVDEVPIDEQASKLRSVIKQHNAAMIRAIDELHALKPSKTRHGELLTHFRKIDELVGGWK
jgi:hypothetical protein